MRESRREWLHHLNAFGVNWSDSLKFYRNQNGVFAKVLSRVKWNVIRCWFIDADLSSKNLVPTFQNKLITCIVLYITKQAMEIVSNFSTGWVISNIHHNVISLIFMCSMFQLQRNYYRISAWNHGDVRLSLHPGVIINKLKSISVCYSEYHTLFIVVSVNTEY